MPERGKPTKQRSWAGNPSAGDSSDQESEVPVRGERNKQSGTSRSQPQTSSTGLARNRDFGSPFGLMHQLSSEMSRMFNNFGFGRDVAAPLGDSIWAPQVDVLRRGDNLVVRADLPGLSKDNISVNVEDNVLRIQGERREESSEEREGYYWHERTAGSFARSIPLPEGANADQATARFENGVLEVVVPAPDREPTRGRRIDIR